MVVLDGDREVIRPAKLWNDTETAPDGGWLLKQLPGGASDWANAVGSVPVAAFTVTKLSWLHRTEPEHWARLAHLLLPHDWMTMRLTGELVTDRGDAFCCMFEALNQCEQELTLKSQLAIDRGPINDRVAQPQNRQVSDGDDPGCSRPP